MTPVDLVRLMEDEGVLQFGEFTLKSGRESPYFFNIGAIADGAALGRLGEAYAHALAASELTFDVVFGPAYKGIPIAVATGVALAQQGITSGVAFNRKEAKAHGEGGAFVGAPIAGARVVLVDDVLTAGTALREASALVQGAGGTIVGVLIAMDREERASAEDPSTAVERLASDLAVPVISLVKLRDVIHYLDLEGSGEKDRSSFRERVVRYRERYCVV